MAKQMGATEAEIGLAVLQIAADSQNGVATLHRLKKEIPNYIKLSDTDRRVSDTRPNEQVWEQRIRNIKSHSTTPGNIIAEGYAKHYPRVGYGITDAGRAHLKNKGLL